jgi:hypothetical protein
MKKQTFFMTLVFKLGFALLFFVGLSSCEKDGIAYETALASASGQTTSNGDSDGKVTTRGAGTCECEYRIYSIEGTPSSGKHLELQAQTWQNTCSPGCFSAHGYYGTCWEGIWNGNPCAYDMASGSLSIFPTRWIPFNCSMPDYTNFNKRLSLTQRLSDCSDSPTGVSSGAVVYGIRCKGACSSNWQYSPSTNFAVTSGVTEFEIHMRGDCGCSPDSLSVE